MRYIFLALLFVNSAICCDFDGDGAQDKVSIIRNRIAQISLSSGGSESIKFPERVTKFSCTDTDADGKDEITYKKLNRVNSFQVIKPKALSAVCKNIRSLVSSEIWKSRASQHISPGDARAASTSFIVLRGTGRPRSNCLRGYAANGSLVHMLGEYSPSGAKYSARFYGGHGCGDKASPSTVRARAIKNGGSPSIYITSGTGNCARIPDPSQCYNSSGC